jgi:hypothetical protein
MVVRQLKSFKTAVRDRIIKWYKQNVVVEWLTLLLLIRKARGYYLSPETDCPD